jgi:hypothetical protein
MTALVVLAGLTVGYLLGRCGWFVLVLIVDD